MPGVDGLSVLFERRALATFCALLCGALVYVVRLWRADVKSGADALAKSQAETLAEVRANAKAAVDMMHASGALQGGMEILVEATRRAKAAERDAKVAERDARTAEADARRIIEQAQSHQKELPR